MRGAIRQRRRVLRSTRRARAWRQTIPRLRRRSEERWVCGLSTFLSASFFRVETLAAVGDCLRKILLHHVARHTETLADFLIRLTVAAMPDERRSSLGRKLS